MNAKDTLFKRLGSQAEVARQLGIGRAAVNDWDVIPAKHAFWAERVTEGEITAEQVIREWHEWHSKTQAA